MPKKLRAVIDANVLISALLFGGTPLELINLWRHQKKFDLVISPELLAEVIGKLKFKFGFPQDLLSEWQELLSQNALTVLPEYVTQICRDPDDDKFIDTALAGGATYLVTGDEDLLALKKYQGIKILKVKEFLKLI